MSGCLSLSSYKLSNKSRILNEEHHHSINLLEEKGINSPHTNNINNKKINSLRRTSSADMSSEKWAQNNEYSLIKRVHSSENLQCVVGEKIDYIVNEEIVNENKGSCGGAAFEDIWSSILSEKKSEAESGDPAPYEHPLMKRASSLSEKSLEICTESLGSETGSDGFSNPLSDLGEGQEGEDEVCGDEVEVVRKNDDVVVDVVCEKYNYHVSNNKKINVGVERSFPPPLPSLVNCDGGPSLHMRTRRHGGKVVVEAVSVPTQNCFRALREDGRLLLTFTGDDDAEQEFEPEPEPEPEPNLDEVVEKIDELSTTMPRAIGIIGVTRQVCKAVSMSKVIELTDARSKSTWQRASNKTIMKSLIEEEKGEIHKLVEMESVRRKIVAHTLPPRPRVNTSTTATTLNAYEYYWRNMGNNPTTTTAVGLLKPLAEKQNNYFRNSASPQVVKGSNKRMSKFLLGNNEKEEKQEKVVLVGEGAIGEKGEYLVPFFRGCKEPRKSLFFWEPYCIATS